jgi:hypothetical protein
MIQQVARKTNGEDDLVSKSQIVRSCALDFVTQHEIGAHYVQQTVQSTS